MHFSWSFKLKNFFIVFLFSGGKGKLLCDSPNYTGYSVSTSKMYPKAFRKFSMNFDLN